MATLRVATWNINSLRLRLPLVKELIASLDPDVICLQETKVPDALFPAEAPATLGYPFAAFRGMKGYNGVAILSRVPFETHDIAPDWCERGDCRHLSVLLDVRGALWSCTISTCRPGATCPTGSRTRNSATSSISSPRRAPGSPPVPASPARSWSET